MLAVGESLFGTQSPWGRVARGFTVAFTFVIGSAQRRAPEAMAAPPAIGFTLLRRIPLGEADSVHPAAVHDALLVSDGIWVLDGASRHLVKYSPKGARVLVRGRAGKLPGEFELPRRLVRVADTIVVMDVTHASPLTAFDLRGNALGARLEVPGGLGATAAGSFGGHLVVATLEARLGTGVLHPAGKGVMPTVVSAIRDGRAIPFGCAEDSAYVRSKLSSGVLRGYAYRDIAEFRGHLLCAQPVNAIVQVLDSMGATVARMRLQPSFYRAPNDQPTRRDETPAEILEYQSSWTVVERIFEAKHGVLLALSWYDLKAGEVRHAAVHCEISREWRPRACREGLLPGRPLRVVQPDTLVVAEDAAGDGGAPYVALYRIR